MSVKRRHHQIAGKPLSFKLPSQMGNFLMARLMT